MSDAQADIFSDRVLRIFIAILVFVFVVLAGPFLVSSALERIYSTTRASELHYTFTLTSTSELSNLTLFIPLPTNKVGTSPVIQVLGPENRTAIMKEWDTSIYGANKETYLKISTHLLAGPSNTTETTYSFTVTALSPALHTRFPLEYDYTLFPKRDLVQISCRTESHEESSQCFQYQTLIFASYDASPDTRVEIRADLIGSNQWKIFREYRNRYTDRISVVLHASVHGWHTAEGYMITSLGDDNPFWRDVPKDTGNSTRIGRINMSMMRWHTITPLP